jgi:hypothetical protein
MGLPDTYRLRAGVSAAHTLVGDGVCTSVVQWIGQHILKPLAIGQDNLSAAAE